MNSLHERDLITDRKKVNDECKLLIGKNCFNQTGKWAFFKMAQTTSH